MVRFGLKILAVPLFLIFCVLNILGELAIEVYSRGMGIIINFILICLVLAAITQQWMNFGIFVGFFVVIALLTLLVGVVVGTVKVCKNNIKEFIAR